MDNKKLHEALDKALGKITNEETKKKNSKETDKNVKKVKTTNEVVEVVEKTLITEDGRQLLM